MIPFQLRFLSDNFEVSDGAGGLFTFNSNCLFTNFVISQRIFFFKFQVGKQLKMGMDLKFTILNQNVLEKFQRRVLLFHQNIVVLLYVNFFKSYNNNNIFL